MYLWEGGFSYSLCFGQGGLMLYTDKTAWISISHNVWICELNCVFDETLNFFILAYIKLAYTVKCS